MMWCFDITGREYDCPLVQKAAKESAAAKENGSEGKVMSVEQAEDLKIKEKRKREREKNLLRKKRKKLEAARDQLEDEDDIDEGKEKTKREIWNFPRRSCLSSCKSSQGCDQDS